VLFLINDSLIRKLLWKDLYVANHWHTTDRFTS